MNANDVVAFVVEMGVLALLAVAGWQSADTTLGRVLLAGGLPLVAALLWGLFAAPRARVDSVALRLGTQVLVLGAGVVAGCLVLPWLLAAIVAIVVPVNLALTYVGPFARPRSVDPRVS